MVHPSTSALDYIIRIKQDMRGVSEFNVQYTTDHNGMHKSFVMERKSDRRVVSLILLLCVTLHARRDFVGVCCRNNNEVDIAIARCTFNFFDNNVAD